MAKKLTYIVWHKIGGLDLMLPIMAQLKQEYPHMEVRILIAELNKNTLIRSGKFYDLFCQNYQIEFIDLLDLLPIRYYPLSKILRYLFRNYVRIKNNDEKHSFFSDFLTYHITKWVNNSIESSIKYYLADSLLLMNEQWWDQLSILKSIPFDKTVILVPHGPVYLCHPQIQTLDENIITGDTYCLFRANNRRIGVLYDSLIRSKVLPYSKELVPISSLGVFNRIQVDDSKLDKKCIEVERLTFIGAPCFDRQWFDITEEIFQTDTIKTLFPAKRKNFRCLFLMSEIVNKHEAKKVTSKVTSSEFEKILQVIIDHILIPYDAELLIKPHPSQNPKKLREIINRFDFKNYIIVDDNISITLLESDLAVTVHSSGSYYPMIYGIPCIHIYKRDYPNQPLFNEMEQNLQRVVFNLDDLGVACQALMDDLTNGRQIQNDTEHMRKYYPDGSIELVMDQIRPYLD